MKKVPKHCVVCNKFFEARYGGKRTAIVCSEECRKIKISRANTKYSEGDFKDKAIELKKTGKENTEIANELGISKARLRRFFADNKIALPPEHKKYMGANGKRRKKGLPDMSHQDREVIFSDIYQEALLGKSSVSDICKRKQMCNTWTWKELDKRGLSKNIPFSKSFAEDEVAHFIQSLGEVVTRHDSSILKGQNRELDIVIPNVKLAIEYCGLFWHSEDAGKDRRYHKEKLNGTNSSGYRLITIFEDEWIHRKDQVKGFLQSVIGKNDIFLHARKCSVMEIDRIQADKFLDLHHIQGRSSSRLNIGIFDKHDLVGVMCFGKHHRKNEKDQIVLTRLCFKQGVSLVGGASKMLKYAVFLIKDRYPEISRVISWSDNRWSEGGVYKKMGFYLDKDLPIDYSYSHQSKQTRLSKQSCRKSSLRKRLGITDSDNHTESELAKMAKLSKIWDCGKKRWVLKIK